VPEHGSSVIRRAQLAAELRRLRERAGYTATKVVGQLGWPGSKLSRIELNKVGVKDEDLVLLLDLYGTGEPRRSELRALAKESRERSRLDNLSDIVRGGHVELMQREAEALAEWNWQPQVIPGLLQTDGYIRAIMAGWVSVSPEPYGYIEDRVYGRQMRQEMVMDRDPPLELRIVMDESVLRRTFVEASVMRAQLGHILEISESPNLDVRILPLGGYHLLGVGAFMYMTFPPIHDVPVPDLVAFEHLTGTHFIDDAEETNKYRMAFKALRKTALEPPESRERITKTLREVWAQ
jgi:transcriptional regulator with XRE-family HTH domain